MPHSLVLYTEEQIQIILGLTGASRDEIIKAASTSQVSMKDIITCLQKIQPEAR